MIPLLTQVAYSFSPALLMEIGEDFCIISFLLTKTHFSWACSSLMPQKPQA